MFHAVMAAIIVPVAIWALWNGYREHRNRRVLYLGITGLVLVCLALALGHYDIRYEYAFMIAGGIGLTAAHWINLRACRAH
jgi:hypothetical protein